MSITDRFLSYVAIDTQSDDTSPTSPSTMKQFVLAEQLVKELLDLGLSDAHVTGHGIVYATLKSNIKAKVPTVGLIAHLDTALEMSGQNVKARVIADYDGEPVVLNKDPSVILSPEEFPHLKTAKGKTLVVTDGTTLLGADNKAGIAIIMTLIEKLNRDKIRHGDIKIAFTPDEEIGRGTVNFDVHKFNADYAYTVDGGPVTQINYENFNASTAVVTVRGEAIHPGTGKGKLVNSQLLAMEYNKLLPPLMVPELTEGYEGFHHLVHMQGSVEKTSMQYIIRDHDLAKLKKHEQMFVKAASMINAKYKKQYVEADIIDGYRNMAPVIEKDKRVLYKAFDAFKKLNIAYEAVPIRGGTDGANLTYKGLLTPNLGTGGYNFHGKYEYAVVEEMLTMVDILQEIVRTS